jgi:hypothetical protein
VFSQSILGSSTVQERKWFWAFPQIEGVPPSPRGGHSATLIGASILYFGVTVTCLSFWMFRVTTMEERSKGMCT